MPLEIYFASPICLAYNRCLFVRVFFTVFPCRLVITITTTTMSLDRLSAHCQFVALTWYLSLEFGKNSLDWFRNCLFVSVLSIAGIPLLWILYSLLHAGHRGELEFVPRQLIIISKTSMWARALSALLVIGLSWIICQSSYWCFLCLVARKWTRVRTQIWTQIYTETRKVWKIQTWTLASNQNRFHLLIFLHQYHISESEWDSRNCLLGSSTFW